VTRCDFCEHRCHIERGKRGRCGIRENRDGTIVTINYGKLVSLALDPVEKKPLYHFLPGTQTLSLALHGCNFSCRFCQNYSISQKEFFDPDAGEMISPAEVVRIAKERRTPSISFTYSEPTVWQDYLLDTARLAKTEGIRTVMVTNGYFTEEALERLLPLVDAFNIDLKGSNEFYQRQCGATQAPVLRNIARIAREQGKVLEVTTLVIDAIHHDDEIFSLGVALAERGVQVWHLSAYHPAYRATEPPTDPRRLGQIFEEIRKKIPIPHLYLGNLWSTEGNDTRCSSCGTLLIARRGFTVAHNVLQEGSCPSCGASLYGIYRI